MLTAEERFNQQYIVDSDTSCWLWTAACDSNSYGSFWVDGKVIKAHRFAYKLKNGFIPEGLHVLHKCDVRICVNPDHLFVGTHSDNMQDKARKGRSTKGRSLNKGERNGMAVLTQEKADEIRRLYATGEYTHNRLAYMFNVGDNAIWYIVNNKRWK